MKNSLRAVLPALTIAGLMAIPAFSTTIALGIAGDASVGPDYISFGVFPAGAPYNPAPGTGIYEVTAPVTDIFATNGVYAGEMGTIQSLNTTLEPSGSVLSTPIQFLTFSGNGTPGTGGMNLSLYLTELYNGNVPGSPFILQDTQTGSTATIDFMGYVLNSTDGTMTPYSGLFQATFSGYSVAQLEANLPVDTAFSGTISLSTVPEPASLLLVGAGLLGAGLVARRKSKA